MATDTQTPDSPVEAHEDERNPLLSALVYWGAHAWMLGYTVVMLMAFSGAVPAGRVPMSAVHAAALRDDLEHPRCHVDHHAGPPGELTTGRYAQGLGLSVSRCGHRYLGLGSSDPVAHPAR